MTGADQTDAVEEMGREIGHVLVEFLRPVTAAAALDRIKAKLGGWLPPVEVARRVDEHLAEVERRIRNAQPRVFGPLDAARIVRDYREEVRHG